ncbi:hypothetical protein [Aurantibacter aestuarii]|uniref:Uncharacterized protein n=1 Tax=Aurantibacter aestuarii TaxID=1266046 RepID=A0A2T1N4Z5_9FLAO|nr:hypothetical protein [Aurantibacter aestuarii]PSG86358.1 hypothetical protein C7H52_11740 [Aurantibacter aestuarii]
METKPQRPQNKWDLIIGLFLIGFGSYRLYQHYMLGAEYETYRIVLTFGFIGFGFYNLYKFFTAPKH